MSNYVPLDEAAKRLGVNPDQLVEMLSRGDIFGYRDGASWKFKPEEIERVQQEMAGDLDEEAGGSSLLLSEGDLGLSGSGSNINKGDDAGSDVALVPDPSSGSGVRLVTRGTSKAGDSDALSPIGDSDGDLQLVNEDSGDLSGAASSDVLGSGVLSGISSASGTGSGGGSKIGSSGSLDLDGDLQLADDDEDDLVLGSGSDLALATDSGINLMSPSDSGLSLEDEPLDLAGTGISGLDLATEGSDVGSGVGSAAASGSLVDFQQDEEFQLSPSGGIEVEEDSGSQVIELEDSTEFGSAPVALSGGDVGCIRWRRRFRWWSRYGRPRGRNGWWGCDGSGTWHA
ncbi:MAG: helix-turn-helix domain-containing protein [Pirellulales bacterium]